ncbi:hypothetical protein CPB85DRAFT_186873 [Mucidula mucida]|nr:hypothetical protein CPB85DRAFT_186873 [Mucidula mucida]
MRDPQQVPREPVEVSRDGQNRKRWGCGYDTCTIVRHSKYSVRMHMNTHTGHKPFKCPETGCSYKASVSSCLSNHRKSRHGYIPGQARDHLVHEFKNLGPSSMALKGFSHGPVSEGLLGPQPASFLFVETIQHEHHPKAEPPNIISMPETQADLASKVPQHLPSILGYSGVLYDPTHPRLPPISSWYRDDRDYDLFTRHPPHFATGMAAECERSFYHPPHPLSYLENSSVCAVCPFIQFSGNGAQSTRVHNYIGKVRSLLNSSTHIRY